MMASLISSYTKENNVNNNEEQEIKDSPLSSCSALLSIPCIYCKVFYRIPTPFDITLIYQ